MKILDHARRYMTLTMLTALGLTESYGQQTCSLLPRIRTVKVEVNGEWGEPPLLLLNGRQQAVISFDDLQASSERYSYTITHCNADWTQSDLIVSEYMTGFNDQLIEDYEPSIGTEMNYCHYTFALPNDDVNLLVSGNYKVNIYQDGEDEPVAQACFSVVEPRVGIDITTTANTDIDSYASNQQVSFSINYSGYHIANPPSELKPVVMQNRRWDNHAEGLQPSAMQINKLLYEHQRSLIFTAGNEYRRFEILDEYVPTLRVESMEYDDEYYHASLFVDEQRINYLYDEDQNGRFLIRNGDNDDNDTRSDYFYTHFTLKMTKIAGGEVYLFGDLTDNQIKDYYRMEYDPIEHQYTLTVPLKQGSYNYMYAFVHDDDDAIHTRQTEGDFHQTENEYWVYVYHRPFGARYDKLIGFQAAKSNQ